MHATEHYYEENLRSVLLQVLRSEAGAVVLVILQVAERGCRPPKFNYPTRPIQSRTSLVCLVWWTADQPRRPQKRKLPTGQPSPTLFSCADDPLSLGLTWYVH